MTASKVFCLDRIERGLPTIFVMDNDMVCFITSGEFTIKKTNPDKEFNVRKVSLYLRKQNGPATT